MTWRLAFALSAAVLAGTACAATTGNTPGVPSNEATFGPYSAATSLQANPAELSGSTEVTTGRPLAGRIDELRAGNSMLKTSGGDYVSWTVEPVASGPLRVSNVMVGRSFAEIDRTPGDPVFFRRPARFPGLPGYELRSAQKLNMQGATAEFIGVFRRTNTQQTDEAIVATFQEEGDDSVSAARLTVLIRSELPLAAASVIAPHHGASAIVNVVTEADVAGTFTLQQYRWATR